MRELCGGGTGKVKEGKTEERKRGGRKGIRGILHIIEVDINLRVYVSSSVLKCHFQPFL